MNKQLAYPRAFVHRNGAGVWALSWRNHGHANGWDSPMTLVHYSTLIAAHTDARLRVVSMWQALGRGSGS